MKGSAGLYLIAVETGWDAGWDATEVGFDAKLLFQPQFITSARHPGVQVQGPDAIEVHDYDQSWPALASPEPVSYPHYEMVCPSWDNSPRAGERAVVLHDSTPEAYGEWLAEALERAVRRAARRSASSSSMRGTSGPRAATSSQTSNTGGRTSKPRARP